MDENYLGVDAVSADQALREVMLFARENPEAKLVLQSADRDVAIALAYLNLYRAVAKLDDACKVWGGVARADCMPHIEKILAAYRELQHLKESR